MARGTGLVFVLVKSKLMILLYQCIHITTM